MLKEFIIDFFFRGNFTKKMLMCALYFERKNFSHTFMSRISYITMISANDTYLKDDLTIRKGSDKLN